MLSTIIVAAGSGRRMGFDKLLAPLGEKPVLSHTIQAFLASEIVEEVILVCPAERFASLEESLDSSLPIKRVDGGTERHHSVKAGLEALSPSSKFVAIHDGARPLITPEAILACYREAQNTQAATLARPVTETIKKADQDQRVETSVSREDLWFMETPQIFSTSLIKKAYEAVEASSTLVTDEVSALQLIGQPTSLVNSPCFNPKITYPSDLSLANSILLQK